MPFIPHTKQDIAQMLATIGVADIATLFDEIPEELKIKSLDLPEGMSEMAITQLMYQRAKNTGESALGFIGAGAYEHFIPAAVWEITGRGEFLTAYTPYQAEASQGTLQVMYEYQTMMAQLTAMEVSNASLYDGASALAEAILMAVRVNCNSKTKKAKRILMAGTIHPAYRRVVETIVKHQKIAIITLAYCTTGGNIITDSLAKYVAEDIAAVVIPQPNFFGVLENVDSISNWAQAQNALVIALVNPLALAILKPPGQWGQHGADIVCGEGQPLGVPLTSGGPYFGFMCCKKKYVRQMPGRIVGRTTDKTGKIGYTLTLQAREQHIRRSKATSNICTNQGLLVTAATIYMSLLGGDGLTCVAKQSHKNTRELIQALLAIEGVKLVFNRPYFHEAVLYMPQPIISVLQQLKNKGIHGGYRLEQDYPELKNCLLVCATETKTHADIQTYAQALADILSKSPQKIGKIATC